mgnify:CR=1 FL=1
MNIAGFIEESLVDGNHVRSVVFISGCKHCCKNCHNPETWDFNYGVEFTKEKQIEIIEKIKKNPLVKGLTISGGDPLYSYKDVIEFLKLYEQHLPYHSIWLYTGFSYEEVKNSEMAEILNYIDVLVDGKYVEDKHDRSLAFRGSSNQNIIPINRR